MIPHPLLRPRRVPQGTPTRSAELLRTRDPTRNSWCTCRSGIVSRQSPIVRVNSSGPIALPLDDPTFSCCRNLVRSVK
jgi:hypothetical protein